MSSWPMKTDSFRQRSLQAANDGPAALKSGGGGDTFDPMEARVTVLEKAVERIDGKMDTLSKDLVDLKIQTATLVERINHLPTKEFIYKGIAGLIAAMVAVSVLGPKLQTLFGG